MRNCGKDNRGDSWGKCNPPPLKSSFPQGMTDSELKVTFNSYLKNKNAGHRPAFLFGSLVVFT